MDTNFIIPLSILPFGFAFIWLRTLYYKRKNAHLQLRLDIAEAITEVINKLRNNPELTDLHKICLNFLLDSYKSKRIVRDLLLVSMFVDVKDIDKKKMKEAFDAMVQESDTVALIVLCVLHASTYNFLLGDFFRKTMFDDILGSPKLAKAASERKDFVKRPDLFFAFGGMPKAA